jgi:hypothetical protein
LLPEGNSGLYVGGHRALSAGMEHVNGDEACNGEGKSWPDSKQDPAASLPEFAEARGLGEDVHDVGGAVRHICDNRDQEQPELEIEREHGSG